MIAQGKPILTFASNSQPKLLLDQTRTSFFNKYRHGPQKISNPERTVKSVINNAKDTLTNPEKRDRLKGEFSYILKWPFKMQFNQARQCDKTYIFEHFDSEESIKRWKPVCDRDSLNGFSTSNISRSPAGHALFHGIIDNTLPDDGLTANSGFSAIVGPTRRRRYLFNIETMWDWSEYNCFEMRFRGDGRKYAVILGKGSMWDDLGWYDNFGYPIYTRGGPYWQTLRIPFSKFIANYRDFIQDRQGYLPASRIRFVSIAIHDKVDGPFALEIDYMGLRLNNLPVKEFSPYERYRIRHMRWRALQVDAPVPQTE